RTSATATHQRYAPALQVIEPIGQGADAVAEGRRLGFGGGGVVAHAEELDGAEGAVEQRALGELVAVLARGVDRSGIDDIRVLLPEKNLAMGGYLAHGVAIDFVDALLVAVAEEANARAGMVGGEELRVVADVRGGHHVLLQVAHAAVNQQ